MIDFSRIRDPLEFAWYMWPSVRFFSKQADIIYGVRESFETYVQAGNMLGKDYVSGYISLSFFLNPVMYIPEIAPDTTECRCITTSVRDKHLDVLWGEIGRFVQTCKYPLDHKKGGPLIINHHSIRKMVSGQMDKISYLVGTVSEKGEGIAGHHARYTLVIGDEASGIDNEVKTQAERWAKRMLWIGNPNPCENFFRHGCKAGNLLVDAA